MAKSFRPPVTQVGRPFFGGFTSANLVNDELKIAVPADGIKIYTLEIVNDDTVQAVNLEFGYREDVGGTPVYHFWKTIAAAAAAAGPVPSRVNVWNATEFTFLEDPNNNFSAVFDPTAAQTDEIVIKLKTVVNAAKNIYINAYIEAYS